LILTKQEMMGWQWRQLVYMQIICNLLQTGNNTSTLSLKFFRLDDLPDVQTTEVSIQLH